MSAQLPPSKPKASLAVVTMAANSAWHAKYPESRMPETFVLAVRAYYRDSMGTVGKNDYGMFDDAFFIVTKDHFSSWNGNTDPSRVGWNPNADKYMARLKPDIYKFQRLKHHASRPDGYMAFGQASNPVTVERIRENGTIAVTETGEYGINLHRAGSGTSSEGCITVPVQQWNSFRDTLDDVIAASGSKTFPLILIDGPLI